MLTLFALLTSLQAYNAYNAYNAFNAFTTFTSKTAFPLSTAYTPLSLLKGCLHIGIYSYMHCYMFIAIKIMLELNASVPRLSLY